MRHPVRTLPSLLLVLATIALGGCSADNRMAGGPGGTSQGDEGVGVTLPPSAPASAEGRGRFCLALHTLDQAVADMLAVGPGQSGTDELTAAFQRAQGAWAQVQAESGAIGPVGARKLTDAWNAIAASMGGETTFTSAPPSAGASAPTAAGSPGSASSAGGSAPSADGSVPSAGGGAPSGGAPSLGVSVASPGASVPSAGVTAAASGGETTVSPVPDLPGALAAWAGKRQEALAGIVCQ
jgi:hypothetical protein